MTKNHSRHIGELPSNAEEARKRVPKRKGLIRVADPRYKQSALVVPPLNWGSKPKETDK